MKDQNFKISLKDTSLRDVLTSSDTTMNTVLKEKKVNLDIEEIGTVISIGNGIAHISGLEEVRSDELVKFSNGILGFVFNLDINEIGVVMLGSSDDILAGSKVSRTGRVVDVPVGEALLGRVIDATGKPLDQLGSVNTTERLPIERVAPPIINRSPVTQPLQTGLKIVDALIPVGRGQRELILGDRQVGKTAVALDTIINQADTGVICIYCAIGRQGSSVAKIISQLNKFDAMKYTIVLVAAGEDAPGLRYIAPYSATSIAEYFMEKGRDVLIVYDDLTSHARAYREISLLLERPPGREAYPGDIFYIHSRLLERSTHLTEIYGGGSLTSLPIIETKAQNISAYIVTNLISITDGQIYLSPELYRKNQLPAIDVGKSVSRVGGKTQLDSYRSVAGDLRLAYTQFEELEMFSRFGTRIDEQTRKILERGRRVRQILMQPQYEPISVSEQVAVLLSVTAGIFDDLRVEDIPEAEKKIRVAVIEKAPEICDKIVKGEPLLEEEKDALIKVAEKAIKKEGTEFI